jgi:hypothetical protein
MQYATTVNKYGNVYAEHFGAWYPVICAVCKHYRVGTREWRNLDTADVALSSCAERSGSALNDRWLFAEHAIDPCAAKPEDCQAFELEAYGLG